MPSKFDIYFEFREIFLCSDWPLRLLWFCALVSGDFHWHVLICTVTGHLDCFGFLIKRSAPCFIEGGFPRQSKHITAQRKRTALLLIFQHLNPVELCGLARVCREWRAMSEHPALWKHVTLHRIPLNNMVSTPHAYCEFCENVIFIARFDKNKPSILNKVRKKIQCCCFFYRLFRPFLEDAVPCNF